MRDLSPPRGHEDQNDGEGEGFALVFEHAEPVDADAAGGAVDADESHDVLFLLFHHRHHSRPPEKKPLRFRCLEPLDGDAFAF